MSEIGPAGEAFNVASFLAQAMDEGMSMRSARQAFRDAGMRMSNQSFASMYAEVRDAIGGREAVQGLDYSAIPPAEAFTTWAAGDAERFSTFVTSFVRRTGEREMEPRYYTYTTDRPHSPEEAVQAAADFLTDNDLVRDSFGNGIYQGSVVTSVTHTRAKG